MQDSNGDLARLERDLGRASSDLKRAESALIVSRSDADGISAGSIADITLERMGIPRRTVFINAVDDDLIRMINTAEEDFVWLCDLGSANLSEFTRQNLIITDHHTPDPNWRRKQTVLDSFASIDHLNPYAYGFDGSSDVSGAGMTYLLSRRVDERNRDLAHLAVVGAVGDGQDSRESRLVGLNKTIMSDAVQNGDLIVEQDLRLFGRETRPIVQFFQYCNDPPLQGLTDDPSGCMEMLEFLNIPLNSDGRMRCWNDLDRDEKERIIDNILSPLEISDQNRIYGEAYTLPGYPKGTGLRDAREFSNVLNSCGRYDDADTGMRICKGDPDALRDAETHRAEHRRNISSAVSYIKGNHLIRERRFIQFFDGEGNVKDSVLDAVTGMILNSPECRRNLPLFGMADSGDVTKISAKANRDLAGKGLDLSILRQAAMSVGGSGIGQTVSGSATIPKERKETFLDTVEELISSQIS